MDTHSFDRIAKLLARRRLSRRSALAAGGAALGMTVIGGAAAAAPGAPGADDDSVFLFVQSFAAGSLVPDDARPGGFTLTLGDGLGQTLYFSDRPRRIVGTLPTATFLARLGFGPDNPPNAVLVLEAAPDDTDVVVMELTAPQYDEATHTATYADKVLSDYEKLGVTFQEAPKGPAEVHPRFGAASLFIDDCSDRTINCCADWTKNQDDGEIDCNCPYVGDLGTHGFCWHVGDFCCEPCANGGWGYWADQCNQTFAACNGNCAAISDGCW
jgi:hypothetical protein